MKRRILSLSSVLVLSCTCLFASFSGRSMLGVDYSFVSGGSAIGITADHIGFFGEVPAGCYLGADADFSISEPGIWHINLIAGPSWRRALVSAGVPVYLELAGGFSMGVGSNGDLGFGLGAYAGFSWFVSDSLSLQLGAKLGNNFISLPLSGEGGIVNEWYLKPQLTLGWSY